MTDKKKILIIEDEQYLRELYSEVLTDAGFEMDSAADGKEGYSKIIRGDYDLVLLDIMLPGIDGLQILENLAKEKKQKILIKKIVLLTNLSKDMALSKGSSYGILGYMIKSDLNPGQLVEAVKGYLL